MTQLRITQVQTRSDRRRFVRFPWQVYRGHQPDPNWVPPLLYERDRFFDPNRSPFLRHNDVALFLAWRGPSVVGTISAHIHHLHNQTHHENLGCWGFFEVLDDPKAADALLETAAAWVKQRGCTVIRGPLNFSINDECGLLIEGFDAPPVAMMMYNPPRYIDYVTSAGWQPAMDLYAWEIHRSIPLPAQIQRVAHLAQRHPQLRFRTVNLRQFDQEVQRGWALYNVAWAQNWGAVPMTEAEFRALAHSLRPLLDPRITVVAEIDDEVVGILIAIPDANLPLREMNGRLLPTGWWRLLRARGRMEGMRVLIMGVHPRYRRRGIDAMLYLRVWEASVAAGYERAELSWILANNHVMNNTLAALGAVKYKTYRLYDRTL